MGRPTPPSCANCGADIPPRARACPECGADERTGWHEADLYDGLDLPETDNDTPDDRCHPAAPGGRDPETGLPWYWTAVALALLIGAILYALRLL